MPAKNTTDRAHASFMAQGRKRALLAEAAQERGQTLGACARDLAVLYLEADRSAGTALAVGVAAIAEDVTAIRNKLDA